MSFQGFGSESLIEQLYDFGLNLREVIIRFNQLPEEKLVRRMRFVYRYLGGHQKEVSAKIDEWRTNYNKIPEIAKNIAGISDTTDKRIKALFDNTELMIAALASRFYVDGKPKEREFQSKEEHQKWVQQFHQYLEEELDLIIKIYPEIRDSGVIIDRLKRRLKKYGKESFLDELPTIEDLEESKRKIMSVYDLF